MRFHGSPEAVAAMASEPSSQSRVVFQAADKAEEPTHRKLGKLTVKYNRKDLQRRLDIEEWIDAQLHLLFDCEVRMWMWVPQTPRRRRRRRGGTGGHPRWSERSRAGFWLPIFGQSGDVFNQIAVSAVRCATWLFHQGDKISFSRMRSAERNFES